MSCRTTAAGRRLPQPKRDAALWRVAGDRAVQFPLALAGGPVAAALVTGNTVVVKGASDTPWAGRLLADCVRDAGVPPALSTTCPDPGARSASIGDAPAHGWHHLHRLSGRGTHLLRHMASGPGRGPASPKWVARIPASLRRTPIWITLRWNRALGYGMGGQKCSALSRLYVDGAVADE